MDFALSDMQQMLLDSADRLMKAQAGVEQWRTRRDLPHGFDGALWNQFAELGWLALGIPEAQGGIGGSFEDMALLMTALGRGLDTSPFISTAVLGAHLIANGTGGARAEALLAGIVAGGVRLALAHDEVGERYGVEAPRATTARRMADGYVLNGVKRLVIDAPAATTWIVSAAVEGDEGTALFSVDADAAGVSITAYPLIDGAHAADIVFAEVAAALIVAPADGMALLADAIDRATVALIAQGVGAMEACLLVCGDYLRERKQFGQPIGNFQALQHMAADMFVATHQARSMLYQALARIDAAPSERTRAVSAAKIVAGEAMQLVSRHAIQVHGGYGLTDEYAVSHFYRRLMAIEKLYGDIDHHIARAARFVD